MKKWILISWNSTFWSFPIISSDRKLSVSVSTFRLKPLLKFLFFIEEFYWFFIKSFTKNFKLWKCFIVRFRYQYANTIRFRYRPNLGFGRSHLSVLTCNVITYSWICLMWSRIMLSDQSNLVEITLSKEVKYIRCCLIGLLWARPKLIPITDWY